MDDEELMKKPDGDISENEEDILNKETKEPKKEVAGSEEEQPKKQTNWVKELISWVIVFAIAAGLALVVSRVILMKTVITSSSMCPTMEVDEHVIANRLAYKFSDPARGDIVFFANPDDESETYVKRIIGLPGEKVEIKKGKVYIDDSEKPLCSGRLLFHDG